MNTYRRLLLILGMIGMFFLSINLESIGNHFWHGSEIAVAKSVNGSRWKQKEFMITMWNAAEPGSNSYAQIAKENYNLVPINYNALPLNNIIERLDAAKKNGLKVVLGDELIKAEYVRDPIKSKQLDKLIDKVKKYSNLEGYFIGDEPSGEKLGSYVQLISYLRKKDPGRLIYLNAPPSFAIEITQPGVSLEQLKEKKIEYPKNLHGIGSDNKIVLSYLAYFKKFVDTIKPNFISYDHYALFKNEDGKGYFLNLALISQVAKRANIPFLNIIQASKYEKTWRLPTKEEMRFQVYTTLAYGGKGISYFIYWGNDEQEAMYRNGKVSPLAKDIAVINSELRNLGPTLMSLNLQGVYHTKPLPDGGEAIPEKSPIKVLSKGEVVVGLFGTSKKTNTFIIANRNYKQKQKVEVLIGVNGKKVQELNRKNGKWISVETLRSSRKFSFTLDAGDGKLFRVL
jgi:hypothetical protein